MEGEARPGEATGGSHHRPVEVVSDCLSPSVPQHQAHSGHRACGQIHNNKMERTNGEVRDREKVIRGLKRMDTPILKGVLIYHNFVRPHEALDGQTPSESAGIKIEGENKWIALIQNAQMSSIK